MSNFSPKTHPERIRKSELDLVLSELTATDHVLEIGGGSGFQAALISEVVASCVSIDVRRHPESRHPVTIYDGRTIPFEDSSFDVIFSSNVLEHVIDLDGLLGECARVLKPGGVMFHIVPSATWRIWTSLTYYPALPMILWGNLRNLRNSDSPYADAPSRQPKNPAAAEPKQPESARPNHLIGKLRRQFKPKWIRTVLLSPRHGERGNELTEAYYFRASWWRSSFHGNGWRIARETPTRLFYSGNILLGALLGIGSRKALSRILGSSTRLFELTQSRDTRLDRKS